MGTIKIISLSSLLAFMHISYASEDKCNLNCENGRLFSEYEKSDKKLNAAYRQLVIRLAPPQRADLRNIQRRWISVRDRVCDETETEWCSNSGCGNGSQIASAANERLECLVDSTNARIEELSNASKAINAGHEPVFKFSLKD
jgi:uncharacterized protein YecT (DUF1311 family)